MGWRATKSQLLLYTYGVGTLVGNKLSGSNDIFSPLEWNVECDLLPPAPSRAFPRLFYSYTSSSRTSI